MRSRKKRRPINKIDAVVMPEKITPEIATRRNSPDFNGSLFGELPNPDPVLKNLGMDIAVYDSMKYDSRVISTMGQRKAAVTSKDWELSGDNPEAEIDFYKKIFSQWNLKDIIEEMLDAWWFGYKPSEVLWGQFEGRIIPVNFVGKPSEWFIYDEENQLRFLSNSSPVTGEIVDKNRFIVSRNKPSYLNPYGLPVAAGCYWPVMFRKNGYKWWTLFMEKYGMPFLWGKAPDGAKTENCEEIADMLTNMVQDAVAVTPGEYDIQLLETKGSNGKNDSAHKTFIDANNTEIAVTILGHNLTTEVQGGSFAASETGMSVRDDIIESDVRIVENSFNELIKLTHSFNFRSPAPSFNLIFEEKIDTSRADRDLKIQQGNPRFKFTPEYYQRKYNLEEDEFIIDESEDDLLEQSGANNGTE